MSLALLLKCHDLAATRRYYASVLDFDVADGAHGTITAKKEDARLIFTTGDLWKRETGCSGTFYIGVRDIDRFYEQVAARTDVAWPLQTMSYGSREFGIIDCNGYTLAFQSEA
jgi:uncharacterized glyoxalase superfamily protein PhnB